MPFKNKSRMRVIGQCSKAYISIWLREGFKKNTANYPHFVDKGGGSSNVDKQWGILACG